MAKPDWETWLIESGHAIIEKKSERGAEALTDMERLTYCLWVADYGMTNAGDLRTSKDLYPDFQIEGLKLAQKLDLTATAQAFGLNRRQLERSYFDRFSSMCEEIAANYDDPSNTGDVN